MTRFVNAFSTGWIVFFGIWGAVALSAVALGFSLAEIAPAVPLLLPLGLAAAWFDYRRPLAAIGIEGSPPSPRVKLLWAAAAAPLALMPFAGNALPLAWGTALLLILTATMLDHPIASPVPAEKDDTDPAWAAPCLVAALLAALIVTLFSNRISWDDDWYLWMPLHLVHHPDAPMIDALTIPLRRLLGIYSWHPHEILVAALARLTGTGVVYNYDYTLPIVGALLTVTEFHLCARLFVGRLAAATTLICVILLIGWGGSHQTFGNFSFDRMFDGKAMLASWAAPAAFRAGFRAVKEPSRWTAALLGMALLCALAQHHDAVIIAPLAALTGAFAGWKGWSRFEAPLVAGGAALVVYGAALGAHAAIPYLLGIRWAMAPEKFALVFRPDHRSVLALASVALAGLLLRPGAARAARRAAFIGVALTLNPYVMEFLSRAIESLSWREIWSFPFVLFTGLTLTGGASNERLRWRVPFVSATALTLFLVVGISTLSPANLNHFGEIGLKIDDKLKSWLDSGSDDPPPKRQ